ncbi:MAG TPA: type II secretion system protein N [Rhodanobacteraceae bacterium]|nr:type II secretion system protein N [Rhodanobacteraceae bacterium]
MAAASWPRLLPRVLVLLLALLGLWLAVRLAWVALTEPAAPAAAPVAAAAAPRATALDVAHWHLFGDGNREQLQKQVLQAQRETELQLTLHGTFAHADARSGYALIADAHGVASGYRVGDTLPGGVKLAAVYADHVVLDNHGRMENLRLPRESLKIAPPAATAGAAPSAAGGIDGGTAAKPTQAIFVAPRMVHGKVDWQQARAQLAQAGPQALLQRLQVQPVFDGTRMRGLRLGRTDPLLTQAGLRAGDLVTAVNGTPLDSPARGQQLAQQLSGATSVQLTVLRDGQPRTVVVDLR